MELFNKLFLAMVNIRFLDLLSTAYVYGLIALLIWLLFSIRSRLLDIWRELHFINRTLALLAEHSVLAHSKPLEKNEETENPGTDSPSDAP